ncbi:hypothetical protein B1987_13735 [Mycobacterium kansasii]|uniref:Helix-turn-helix domain-containing protein n=1 Tax=Mycobacterium attenuatum TaxID=2341086 RepID=A0A498QHF4_9MYCO|nr:helix-turn-helix domain-containing protein [Mycobacterium attenuatum]ORB87514.1 hypothetical protein B1987_13735 [Mycobacterium kansasii]VBA43962.1 hypothetical protein LAUMK136_05368 [Mycobacterium attenuatum]
MDSLPALMTTAEVAEFIRASKQSLDQDRYLGRGLPYVRIGRKIRYERAAVLKFLADNRISGDAA